MSHRTVARAKAVQDADLQTLKAMLREHDITHDDVAAEASKTSKRGRVGRTLVSHVFADPPRAKSANVVEAARRLVTAAIEARRKAS